MPYENGTSGNPTGRPKGAANKVTKQVRKVIGGVLAGVTVESLQQKLEGLQGKEFLDAYVKLAEFVTPKLQRVAQKQADTMPTEVTIVLGEKHPSTSELLPTGQQKMRAISPIALADDE